MLWISINYWPAMRTAFEILLALPALLFAAALWTGARHRRRLRDGKLFTGANRENRENQPAATPADSTPFSPLPPVQNPRLSDSGFEQCLIHVEELRARGDHAAADAMLASLHGQGPAPLAQ